MRTCHPTFCKSRNNEHVSEHSLAYQDYDCFYASVFEAENPRLKGLPLAVQQKQIIVTCNYEARRRGLYKLQLISEAKRLCPDVIIVLGEDLTKFRDVSKSLARFLTGHVWSGRCERLGFDETWLDCTTMIDYNVEQLSGDLRKSFFHLDQGDSALGFEFDATVTPGQVFPTVEDTDPSQAGSSYHSIQEVNDPLTVRLRLGSHLAAWLRARLEDKGFTATVGISVNKLLSKLVGSLHKPNNQTTLMPPYNFEYGQEHSSVSRFLDQHEVGKIPGIGFKISHKLREMMLGRQSNFQWGFAPDVSGDGVLVRDLRLNPELTSGNLQKLIGGPGWPKDIGQKVHELINGVDDSEVAEAKLVPTQISIEDSYRVLDTMKDLRDALIKLSISLIKRMRVDLVDDSREDEHQQNEFSHDTSTTQHYEWLAIPRTLRLSTRPRPPRTADGARQRAFQRISRSAPFPTFLLSSASIEGLAERLVEDLLVKLFHRLHPEDSDWDLSLVNIAVTNMSTMAGESRNAQGRDISKMLLPVTSTVEMATNNEDQKPALVTFGSEDNIPASQESEHNSKFWNDEAWTAEDERNAVEHCRICGASMPAFAFEAHLRFHLLPD